MMENRETKTHGKLETDSSRGETWLLPCFADGTFGRAIGSPLHTLVVVP